MPAKAAVLVPRKFVMLNARLVIVACEAVLLSRKEVSPPLRFAISAVPAVDVLWKVVKPSLFAIAAALAEVPLKKCVAPPNLLVIDVMPTVLALTMLKMPSFVTSPRIAPTRASVPSWSVEQAQLNVPPV